MNCTHHFFADSGPKITCRKCGDTPFCDIRTRKTIFGRMKYPVKQHNFVKGWCVNCGMNQWKVGDYREVEA